MVHVVGPGIDHRQGIGADDIGVGALEGERARVVGDDALNPRHQLARLAVDEVDALAEIDRHGRARKRCLREREAVAARAFQ
jgi:hypothetical protein